MTQPRRHLAGQVVHLTRRCFQRTNLMRPDTQMNRIGYYETARASVRHGQTIHVAMAMSNHIHQCVSDTTGNRSDYMRDSMREISRARNTHLKRQDATWDGRPFGDTVLMDRDAIERQLVYIVVNPVRAGLVATAEDWPGFKILPRHWGKTLRVKRPKVGYHSENSPEEVEFTPMPPPGYEDMSLEEVRAHFEALIKEAEEEIRRERRGKKVVGVVKICTMDPFSRPKSRSRMGGLSPRFATKDKELMAKAIGIHKQFQAAYQRQRKKWLRGERVTFPCGTVQLRREAPIRCKPPDDEEPGLFEMTCAAA